MLLLFMLSGLALSVASNFEALSAADAKLSKIGTLVYSSLSDGTQYNLFRNYQTEYEREVSSKLFNAIDAEQTSSCSTN
jgi:hypothetical protein